MASSTNKLFLNLLLFKGKLRSDLMKKANLKKYLFILPLIILIGVFSIWPILQAFSYTFFDYRLNDQQKSKLYLSDHYNVTLSNENTEYIIMFLEEDKENMDVEGKVKTDEIIKNVEQLQLLFKDKQEIIKLNKNLKNKVISMNTEISEMVNNLDNKYDLVNDENLKLVVDDLNKCVIKSNFIGLKGYANVFKDKRISQSLGHTLIFTIFSVFLEFVLGLFLAIIMNKAIKGRGLIRTSALIPWAIPTAVAALMWSYLYDGSNGIIAYLFENIGILNSSKELLLTSTGAMISSILADVWKTTPYMALLLLAGFQTIPSSVYESCKIDGANKIQTFFKITLPLLKPSILVALLFRTLDAFRVFDLIYVLTGGGPGGSTETLSIYAYKLMFGQTNFGYGSIVVLLMFVCVAIIATIFVKVLGTDLMEKN
jgi:trehalose/maltose transport system permease protein